MKRMLAMTVVSPKYNCEKVKEDEPASTQPFVYEYGGGGGDFSAIHVVRLCDSTKFPFSLQVAPVVPAIP